MHERHNAPKVSIVVPVHGDRGRLRATLERLHSQEPVGGFDVVVVDNGENSKLSEIIDHFPGVTVVEERRPGSYVARNAGVRATRSTIVAFTDADCLPSAGWLREGLAALEAAGPGAFVGGAVRMVLEHGGRPNAAELWQLGNDLRQEVYVRERGWAVTANLLVHRDDLERVGLFDEHAESGGDREWGERASALGLRAVYAPAALVEHPARGTLGQLHRKIARVTRGAVHRQRRHGVLVYQEGLARALVPNLRSSWRRSAEVSPRWTTRVRYAAVSVWIHEFRGVYAAWLLTRPAAAPPR